MKRRGVAIALGASMLTAFVPGHVAAQTTQGVRAAQRFDIPAGSLAAALQAWSKVTKLQIVYRMDDVGRKRTNGIHGDYAPLLALQGLLIDTGLKIVTTEDGAVAIRPLAGDEVDTSATPDILVTGRVNWSLNTGIERTQDDSQPFIVLGRKEIERSGAPNLEAFLRNQLNVNTSPTVGDQAIGGNTAADPRRPIGVSAINLRGIGLRDTLILVDGRRQPGINLGNGDISQPSITGIPIAAVERIEVLASSASGIYGSGASGGVINIVLRRDFKGAELSANYDNTSDFKQGRGSIDLTGGLPLEGGRTRLTFTGNWTRQLALRYGDRDNLRRRGLNDILANDPGSFYGGFTNPPQGSLVNFKTQDGTPLQLKPEYGGQTLSSSLGTIPKGYAGITNAGLAPLLSSLGTFNLDQANTAAGTGARAPLLYPVNQYSGSIAARRTFNNWLTAYAEIGMSHSSATNTFSNTLNSVFLNASAIGNPFTQDLAIAFPANPAYDAPIKQVSSTLRTLGGAIIRLPADWQAVAEVAYSKSNYSVANSPPSISVFASGDLQSGVLNALVDTSTYPLPFTYDKTPYYQRQQDGKSSNVAPSLRLAGPLPFSLPGGKPQLTVNAEINTQRLDSRLLTLLTDDGAVTTFTPTAHQTTKSVYGEIVFPILGDQHQLPLIRLLELRLSARHESYKGDGTDTSDPVSCREPLVAGQYDYFGNCPPAGTVIPRSTTTNAHTDPSISLLWSPINGVTLRGSYTTGYLPPQLSQLVKLPRPQITLQMRDPQRGNELIGMQMFGLGVISGFSGGNPDVRPESSKTWTAGLILKPHFIDGLRFSVDWTRIHKRDMYFDPVLLLASFFGGTQSQFNQFIASNPDRVTRGPASGGFAVGPITALDVSLINLKSLVTSAYDFTLNYDTNLFGGQLSAVGRATYVDQLVIQPFADAPAQNYAGVVTAGFAAGAGASGSLRFRGSGSLQWTKNELSLGWQTRYLSSYYLTLDRSFVAAQGSAKVASQMYHDMNISYRLPQKMTVRFGINNIFNKMPPLDVSQFPLYYSAYGDPRLRNFYLGVSKSF